ncbi:MAG: hypothetical protein BWY88_00609 [Synergistetes bacterium ADurb.Bin520]|nr:MAG: hypothetical protein BWY88_00609 [Synergistetes bacterium ADurb.Bin520]
MHVRHARAAHHHGLEIFRTHDGPHTAPSRRPILIVHDRRQQRELFPRRADTCHPGLVVADLGKQHVGGLMPIFAPHLARVAELHFSIFYPEIGGGIGLAFEDKGKDPRLGQLRPPKPPGVAAGDIPREGALGDHHVSPARRRARTGKGAAGKDELVLRRKGVGALGDLVIDHLRGVTPTANVVSKLLFVHVFPGNAPFRQINAQDTTELSHGLCASFF